MDPSLLLEPNALLTMFADPAFDYQAYRAALLTSSSALSAISAVSPSVHDDQTSSTSSSPSSMPEQQPSLYSLASSFSTVRPGAASPVAAISPEPAASTVSSHDINLHIRAHLRNLFTFQEDEERQFQMVSDDFSMRHLQSLLETLNAIQRGCTNIGPSAPPSTSIVGSPWIDENTLHTRSTSFDGSSTTHTSGSSSRSNSSSWMELSDQTTFKQHCVALKAAGGLDGSVMEESPFFESPEIQALDNFANSFDTFDDSASFTFDIGFSALTAGSPAAAAVSASPYHPHHNASVSEGFISVFNQQQQQQQQQQQKQQPAYEPLHRVMSAPAPSTTATTTTSGLTAKRARPRGLYSCDSCARHKKTCEKPLGADGLVDPLGECLRCQDHAWRHGKPVDCTYVRSEARIMKAAGRAAPTAMDGMYTSAIR